MIQLGSIPITQPEAIREARKKVRLVVEAVTGNPVTATRLATVTSEMARRLLHEAKSARIDVALELGGRTQKLTLAFVGTERQSVTNLLAPFFDAIEGAGGASGESVVRGLIRLPPGTVLDRARIASLEAIVQQKSRDELMAEIQATNVELQDSLD